MPSVALTTLGCKVNQVETEIMEGLFKARGYEVVSFDDMAEVYVINTCSVTHLGERKSRQLIRRAGRMNPKAVIAVAGCYSQAAPDQIKAIEGVRVIVGTNRRDEIVDLVERAQKESGLIYAISDIMQAKEFEDIPLFHLEGRTRAFLKIQEGCANFCTYCIIPYTRGPLRSRKLSSVKDEGERLVREGFKEIVLTGIHLGAYGKDLSEEITLVDAVKVLLSIKELKRLRLGSLESIELSPELFDVLSSDDRFCPHLHLPLQAGQDEVLKAMNRHYTTNAFKALMQVVVQKTPNIAISTDIIVGFPGETDEKFQQGLEFVRSMEFSKIHVFPYSKRDGTPAAGFANQIAESVKKERVRQMQQLAEEKADAFRRKFIGRTCFVLFETKQNGIADGLTGNYIRVYSDSIEVQCGEIFEMLIERIYEDGLWGKICK